MTQVTEGSAAAAEEVVRVATADVVGAVVATGADEDMDEGSSVVETSEAEVLRTRVVEVDAIEVAGVKMLMEDSISVVLDRLARMREEVAELIASDVGDDEVPLEALSTMIIVELNISSPAFEVAEVSELAALFLDEDELLLEIPTAIPTTAAITTMIARMHQTSFFLKRFLSSCSASP